MARGVGCAESQFFRCGTEELRRDAKDLHTRNAAGSVFFSQPGSVLAQHSIWAGGARGGVAGEGTVHSARLDEFDGVHLCPELRGSAAAAVGCLGCLPK